MSSHTLHSPMKQHECLMTPLPQARRPGRLSHRTAQQRYVLPLLGALVCLLLVVGTSHAYWVSLSPRAFTRLCPTHSGGDREYAGHGPNVTVWAFLLNNGSGTLSVSFDMHQQETQSDWSKAFFSKTYWLYSAPAGHKITYIWNNTVSHVSYTDTNHTLDRFYPPDTLVGEFDIMGDTSGNDIGNCTADDAYLSVYLETIWVWVEPPMVLAQ